MNIVIDIGNSRFKSAVVNSGEVEALAPIPWRDDCDLEQELDKLWQGLRPERVIACNVAGDNVVPTLHNWCRKNLQIDVEIIRTGKHFQGLINGYEEPERLGTDRWAAMIGARAHYKGALCVIDSGTATTVDVINAQGRHLGGAILPGVYTMRRALGKYTAALFTADGVINPFSTNTAAGIAGGTGYASVGAIDRLIDEAKQRLIEVTTVFTGGEAAIVAPFLRNQVMVDEPLVLKGVIAIADSETKFDADGN